METSTTRQAFELKPKKGTSPKTPGGDPHWRIWASIETPGKMRNTAIKKVYFRKFSFRPTSCK